MKPCSKPYGALPAMCRRILGHDGECGPGCEVEHALIRAWEVTAHLRKLEREGEHIPDELWNMRLRDIAPETKDGT